MAERGERQMTAQTGIAPGVTPVTLGATSSVVLVCEHATHHVPAALDGLGLAPADRTSHAAWDPGALAVARHMAEHLGARLVAAEVSRLVCDCNRPPDAPDAMPARSELIEVPGNRNLGAADRAARIAAWHRPFHDRLARTIAATADPVLVTVHSFTPVYFGVPRTVEIGILHDADARLADAMLEAAATTAADAGRIVARNQPYGPADGVTHTLRQHALPQGHPNVMLEIRNDLIATEAQQRAMAETLSGWLVAALARPELTPGVACGS